MTIAPERAAPPVLTYEDYMAEEEINRRYDILDGVRIFMTNPTRKHQRIQRKLLILTANYEEISGAGQFLAAPCDILITRIPLRTRQPDVLFISNERLAQNPPFDNPAPLDPAPELVVEIVSPSDGGQILDGKLRDYCRVGVKEAWIVRPATETIDTMALSAEGYHLVATYGRGDTVHSLTFAGLTVPVEAVFVLE